jgi:hypothetical protein
MMGTRYFLYRVHSLSVAEVLSTNISDKEYKDPMKIPEDLWNNPLK